MTHICIQSCLAWGKSSSILAAGNNYKVVIYNNIGKMIKDFDYTNEDNIKEYGCCAISNSGDAIALGNTDSFYIYFYNELNKTWDYISIKNYNYNYITSICWKPDKTSLIIGNLINSADIYEIYLSKTIIKEIFEITFITNNYLKITNN